jgi:hypothetical protein
MTAQPVSIPPSRPASRVRHSRLWTILLLLLGALGAGALLNLFVLWPWMQNWGATKAERNAALPGDELVPDANLRLTKGMTINAPPAAIYPWLLQIGVDRGGMYSYDWLENLFGLDVHSADRIVPEYQQAHAGDFWRFTPRDYFLNPGPGLYVRGLIPDRAVLLTFGLESKPDETPFFTWQFILEPQPDGSTRLLLRSNMKFEQELPIKLTYFIQFLMERKMLIGIRDRAEGLS